MMVRFIGMLQAPYYEKVARSFSKNFVDVVILDGKIDKAMKNELKRKNICKDKRKEKIEASK